ncbi:cobyrinic acid a,c-diamide synthase [Natronobacterium gregoryi]|uniref:Cobyrinate a,c-diamide synthase n=2 Tax=Natronobacterium gregoryi TaxID=44930 RepID=L0AFF6_NATGS|nr:cobyrinic acid a,c-diamide synthase [Natronobacterium gregoryi]AFZ71790.1 cobyrinic acid a,c-diamide synthase [Natronobacterium gregoryi SP2]ELY72825.1 cobyrinic acid a,c-diamide synthase [Natronobacterium gregoryi SP2]PLK21030.1 cobyrinate a,c-diamide synthase [Natronobacterium gregoryi SP2]SFI87762.1 hydrogenobyrinic acid a,c-diamide synthase (glutamine-hydrolysing) /cobyrinate a,c-diamide synthase [Natronobacterium gregoryi]
MQGFVLAGVSSGVGKTVATLAVIQALEDAGYDIQPAKAGPDFIDPSHHGAIADRPSRTLDLWLEGETGVRRNYARGEGDVCVVEGVMGLYDGDGSSTAMVAETLDLPVVLVIDASAGMESVGATALGFREYAGAIDRDIDVAGVVAQQAHGGRHEEGIREALPDGLEYFGRIPPNPALEIPDRHLGLEMGEEAALPREALREAAETLEAERLGDVASAPPEPAATELPEPVDATVAVASDAAFCFRYPATVERFRERGEVVTFSPVVGDPVPDCDGVYLPGGYPELHADALESSDTLAELGDRASDGLPIFGECGGLMAMSRSLTTAKGDRHEMAGILPADVTMHDRYQALDHVELETARSTLTADAGETVRGHEFHYSSIDVDGDARFAFETVRGDGIDGDHDGLLGYESLATYAHVHPESGAFDRFLEAVVG